MRIIAGKWRGRPLVAPAGQATRPTSDRVRETLFNMLVSRLGSFEELRVADFYAGSGALGFEALSRGASSCVFVDHAQGAQQAIRANAARLGCDADVRASLPSTGGFDLIFADPPYGSGLANAAVRHVAERGLLSAGGWMSVETERGEKVDPSGLAIESERSVGRAKLSLLRRA